MDVVSHGPGGLITVATPKLARILVVNTADIARVALLLLDRQHLFSSASTSHNSGCEQLLHSLALCIINIHPLGESQSLSTGPPFFPSIPQRQ